MNWTWLILLVFCGLATFRLTRLVVKDDFPPMAAPREWIVGENGEKHWGKWYYTLGELISCHWCASGWISLGLTIGAGYSYGWSSAHWIEWSLLWIASWAVGSVVADKVG